MNGKQTDEYLIRREETYKEMRKILAALAADYANLCDKFCKSPECSAAYRAALEVLK